MQTNEVLRRLEAMERQATAMETLAEMLLGQAQRQRREIAGMKAALADRSTGSATRVEAPSLAAMLRTPR
jgi:hypothetical protein